MPQIIRLTSEALQASIRRLLPSQQGFGLDLEATNVITPIIDLTPTAEGSVLPVGLQSALAFGSQTSYSFSNSNGTILNTAGFYRIFGQQTITRSTTAENAIVITMTDGSTLKNLYNMTLQRDSQVHSVSDTFDFIVYLRSGDSVTCSSNAAPARVALTVRQLADVNGNLVNPAGFTSE